MTDSSEELLRRAYAAFNERDIEAALALMQPAVDWPNAWEGGRVIGREAVRQYWTRQFAAIDSHVQPLAFSHLADGRIAVDVLLVARDRDGRRPREAHVVHVYELVDGLVARMDVVEPPAPPST
jgi:ketosteroid isomerase-like protein